MATKLAKKPEAGSQVFKKPEMDVQVEEKTECYQSANLFDLIWDSWLNSVRLGEAYQREIGGMALQAMQHQRDFWVQNNQNLERVRNECYKYTDEAKSLILENLKNLNMESVANYVQEWNNRAEEVTNHLQKVYETPGKTCCNFVEKSYDQLESTWKTMIHQQQDSREEVQTTLENLIDQAKETNKRLVKAWESNRNSCYNLFK